MNRRWKQELKQIYQAPEPKEKDAFLARLEEPGTSLWEFLRLQFSYMRKWNFLLAAGIFGLALCAVRYLEPGQLWGISALVPFLALSVAAEGARSVRFGMDELEMAARFPLKTVLAARIGILGIGNLVLLGVIFPFVCRETDVVFVTGLCLLTPYLLTAFCNLLILRRSRREDGVYFCFGATVLISGMYAVFQIIGISLAYFAEQGKWILFLAVFATLAGREVRKTIKQSEEYVWNL